MVLRKLYIHMQKNIIRPLSITLYRNYLQMAERLKCETWNTETVRKKDRQYFTAYRYKNGLQNRTLFAQELRPASDKWDDRKLNSFCMAKETINQVKRRPTKLEKIFASSTIDRGLISRIYKELKNSIKNKWPILFNLRSKQRILKIRVGDS